MNWKRIITRVTIVLALLVVMACPVSARSELVSISLSQTKSNTALGSGWGYYKTVTISRASGAVTNYQMKLLVGESSGASGEDVDCGGHVQTDFDDIRFTASDGTTLLDYWIEVISGSTPNQLATIWIEFDSIGTSATTFYMYYGNASAAAYSNGANTFIKFEDFEWGSDGDDITDSGGSVTWTKSVAGTSTAKIDTGQKYSGSRSLELYRDGTNSLYTYFSLVGNDNISIQFRARKNDTANLIVYNGNGTNRLGYNLAANEDITIYDGTGYIDTTANCAVDTWELHELNNFNWSSATVDAYLNGAQIADDADISWASVFGSLRFLANAGTSYVWIDNVIVRRFLATEPAWGSWGSETIVYSISNTPTSKAFGVVAAGSTYYAYGSAPANPVHDDNCTFTITNSGATCKLQMKITDFTGGNTWNIVASAPSGDEIRVTSYYSGQNPASGLVLSNSDQDFKASMAAGTLKWDFKIETSGTTGDMFSDGSQKTATITISAVAP